MNIGALAQLPSSGDSSFWVVVMIVFAAILFFSFFLLLVPGINLVVLGLGAAGATVAAHDARNA